MDAKYLAEIKAREQAATSGPWKVGISALITDGNGQALFFGEGAKGNAAFIVNARTDIPALVAEVERLEKSQLDPVEMSKIALALNRAKELETENATLKKALEMSCKDHADGCTWNRDTVTVESLMEYYVRESQPQQAQEQEGKK